MTVASSLNTLLQALCAYLGVRGIGGISDSIEIGKWDVDELLIEAGQLSSSDSDPFDSRLAGWSG
jgi:hypothetical protein